jgi:hypothetical protein
MFIEDLTIKGYGKLKDFAMQPGSGLNVVYGPNEAGKSSLGNCIRDLLLGPGNWEGELHGPRTPEAKPWDGGRFAARLRYRVEDGTVYMLQRDFEMGACRIRDDTAGVEVPYDAASPAAPGIVAPRLDEPVAVPAPPPPPPPMGSAPPSPPRPAPAPRSKVKELEAERSRWSYRYHKVQLERLGSVLERIAQIEKDIAALEPQLAELEARAATATQRPKVIPIKNQGKVDALENEIALLRKSLEGLQEKRKATAAQLTSFEKYFNLAPEQIEALRALEKTDLSGVDEKRRNMEGFRFKETDISRRLKDFKGAFEEFASEEAFELRISDLEKGAARNEQLGSKMSEQQRLQSEAEQQQKSNPTSLVLIGVGASLAVFPLLLGMNHDAVVFGGLPIGILVAVSGVGLKFWHQGSARRLLQDAEAMNSEVERLRAEVSQAREQLKVIMDKAKVSTLKDLRAQFREYQGLQRDLTTVREYIAELEANIEAMSSQSPAETPKALLEVGLLKPGEAVTSRVLATFFENHALFEKLRKEDADLKKKASDIQEDIERKRAQQTRLSESSDEAAPNGDDAGDAYRKLKEQIEVLRKRMLTLCQGSTPEALRHDLDEARHEVERLDAADPAYAKLKIDAHAMPEYRERLAEFDEKVAKARAESGNGAASAEPEPVAADEPATAAEPAADGAPMASAVSANGEPPTSAEPARVIVARRIQHHFASITGQEISVRLEVADDGRLSVRISRDGSIWAAPITLGRSAAELLEGLLAAELGRAPLGGNLPIILDNPFARLDEARQQRACEWLLEVSAETQVFYFDSETATREALRALLSERKLAFKEQNSGELQIIASERPATTAGTGQTSAA